MTERVFVCTEEEFDERALVTVDGTEIGVVNVDGSYYAIANRCAHLDGPVCSGNVHRAIRAEFSAGDDRVTEILSDRPTIACPWHGWEYDLATGAHLGDPDVMIPTYDVLVERGSIYLEL